MKNLQLCTNLKRLRKERKESKENLSELLEVNPATYYRWENGQAKIPFEAVAFLSDYYDVDIYELMGKKAPQRANSNVVNMKDALRVLSDHAEIVELIAQFPKDHMYILDAITVLETGLEFMREDEEKERSKKA